MNKMFMDGSEIFSMYKIGCHVKILGVGFSIGFSACKPSSKVLCWVHCIWQIMPWWPLVSQLVTIVKLCLTEKKT